jgi:hypothetical protein
VFGEHWNPYPEGWGARAETNPPHYPWLIAVDPRGAVLVGGFGSHGVSRLRARRNDDPTPARYHPAGHEDGRFVWATGAPWIWPGPPGSARHASRPASLKYGWNAHNYLGLADAWELRGDETDEQLLNYFEAAEPVRADAEARALWLEFVRANRGAPVPDCPKPAITAQPSGSGGTLTVGATGIAPLSFAWFAGESGDTRTPVENADANTLRTTSPERYWVRVSNRCGIALSSAAASSVASPRRRSIRH